MTRMVFLPCFDAVASLFISFYLPVFIFLAKPVLYGFDEKQNVRLSWIERPRTT